MSARLLIPPVHVDRSGGGRTPVSLNGADVYRARGAPSVPVIRKFVAVPECASIEIEVTGEPGAVVRDVDIPVPVDWAQPSDDSRLPVRPARKVGNGFPGYLGRVRDAGHLRGQRLALLELFPVQYDARRRQATTYDDLRVTLTFKSPRSAIHANVGPMENSLRRMVINPTRSASGGPGPSHTRVMAAQGSVCWVADSSATAAAASVSSCGADYLIIVADTLSHDADSLLIQQLASKRASYNGLNVAVVRARAVIDYAAPDTLAMPVAIRNFVKTVYDDSSAAHMGDRRLAYVLLIGDAFDPARQILIPMYYGYTADNVCDSYYSFLTDDPDDDRFPDVFLGRFPVDFDSDQWELRNVVNTTVAYEPQPAGASWLDKILLASGGRDSDYSFVGQGLSGFDAFFDSVIAKYIPATKVVTKMHDLDPQFNNFTFSQAVADSLRLGYGVCVLFDHGFGFYLAGYNNTGCFLPVDYDALGAVRPPFVMTQGSYLGEFDFTRDQKLGDPPIQVCCPTVSPPTGCLAAGNQGIDRCDVLAERLLVQPQGAVGVLASSRSSPAGGSEATLYAFFAALFQENSASFGEILVMSKTLAFATNEDLLWLRNLTLFGDPAASLLWRDVPHDSVDLAVRRSDIGGGVSDRYLSASGDALQITVRNEGPMDAVDASIDVWRGHPDSTYATLIASSTVSVAAYDTALVSLTTGRLDVGRADVFVQLNAGSTIAEPTLANNLAHRRLYVLPYLPGFPIRLPERAHHPVVIRDVHPSVGKEILLATVSRVYCFGADGGELWHFRRPNSVLRSGPVVANLHKDGHPYVLCEVGSYTYLLDAVSGTANDSIANDTPTVDYWQSYTIGDLLPQSAELVYLRRDGSNIEARTAEGATLWRHTPSSFSLLTGGLALCDLDSDGDVEAIASTGGKLSVYDGDTGSELWSVDNGGLLHPHSVVAFDGDGDGDMELLATSMIGTHAAVAEYDHESTRLWLHEVKAQGYATFLASGDLERTGDPFVVVSCGDSLRVFTAAGVLVHSASLGTGTIACDGLLVGDVVGDNKLEIVAVSSLIPPTTSAEKYIRIVDSNLNQIGQTLIIRDGPFVSQVGRPAIGDIDGDGSLDFALVSSDSVLHVFRIGDKAGSLAWPSVNGNAMLTNVYAQPVIGSYSERLSLFNNVDVLGDVTCDSSVYVDGTATIRVSDTDATNGGVDASRVEIVLRDKLNVRGSERQRPRIVGWDGVTESSDPDSWWGIFISDTLGTGEPGTGRSLFEHCDIRNAAYGIQARRPVTLRNCVIDTCDAFGVRATDADTVVVNGTVIRGTHYAIYASSETTVLLSNSAIADCSQYGVIVQDDSRLAVTGTSFDGNALAVYLSKGTGSWVKGSFRGCSFSDNWDGIRTVGTGDSSVTVDDCAFAANTTTGIAAEAAHAVVDSVTTDGGEFGITAQLGSTLLLSNSTIGGASLYGVAMAGDSRLDATGASFVGNDIGLYLAKSAGSWVKGTVRSCTFTSNGDGIWIDDVGDSSMVVDDCVIDENTTNGVYVEDNGAVTITRSTITNNTIGVYSYFSDPEIRSHNVIQYNSAGIKCDNSSYAVVESCTVTNNGDAVAVVNNADADLGHVSGGSSTGYNIFKPTTNYYVSNLTSNMIDAQRDYWPRNPPTECNPTASKFYGSVDRSSPLCTEPTLMVMEWPAPVAGTPARFGLRQNYPNPFNPTTTIAYDVPRPGSWVEISLYDVTGALVARLVDENKPPGSYSVTWDGENRKGEAAATGVYFLRMRAGPFVETKKLLLLK